MRYVWLRLKASAHDMKIGSKILDYERFADFWIICMVLSTVDFVQITDIFVMNSMSDFNWYGFRRKITVRSRLCMFINKYIQN